ncbi:hypothetical protein KAX01_00990, partial [Candidatus Bathyarchaeota archaeon]|nr:hypothetical protein [Candidatus Bathyarchaeota archaeon]
VEQRFRKPSVAGSKPARGSLINEDSTVAMKFAGFIFRIKKFYEEEASGGEKRKGKMRLPLESI